MHASILQLYRTRSYTQVCSRWWMEKNQMDRYVLHSYI